jgi:hypothetical protein
MQRQRQVIVVIALMVLMAARAAAAESGWSVRLYGVWGRPSLGLSEANSEVPIDAASNGALGAGAGLEYRFGRWVGLGFDLLHARPDIVLEVAAPSGPLQASHGLGFTPISVGPVFHVTPGRRVDLTLTAVLGVASYGDLQFASGGQTLRLQGGNAAMWGLGAAVDVSPGSPNWTIHAGVRCYQSSPEFTNRDNGAVGSAAVNPVVVSFGIGYRF